CVEHHRDAVSTEMQKCSASLNEVLIMHWQGTGYSSSLTIMLKFTGLYPKEDIISKDTSTFTKTDIFGYQDPIGVPAVGDLVLARCTHFVLVRTNTYDPS